MKKTVKAWAVVMKAKKSREELACGSAWEYRGDAVAEMNRLKYVTARQVQPLTVKIVPCTITYESTPSTV